MVIMARFTAWRPTRSAVALTVGIIVLAALVLGGLHLAKERGEQVRREEAIKVAEAQLETNADEDIALNSGDEETQNEEQNSGSTAPGETSGESSQPNPSALPETGPSEAFSAVIVALVAFSAASYVTSRKALRQQ